MPSPCGQVSGEKPICPCLLQDLQHKKRLSQVYEAPEPSSPASVFSPGMRGALSPPGVDPLSSEGCEQSRKAGDDFFTMAPGAPGLGHCRKPGIVSLFWGNYYVTRKHWSPQASVQMSGPHEVKHLASLTIHSPLLGFSLFLPSFFSSSSSLFKCFAWVDSNGPPSCQNDLHPRPQEI